CPGDAVAKPCSGIGFRIVRGWRHRFGMEHATPLDSCLDFSHRAGYQPVGPPWSSDGTPSGARGILLDSAPRNLRRLVSGGVHLAERCWGREPERFLEGRLEGLAGLDALHGVRLHGIRLR